MSLFKPRFVKVVTITALVMGAMALSACGFRPVYGTSSTNPEIERELSTVKINLISDRVGQMLRTELTRQFNPRGVAAKQTHTLSITLTESIQKLAVAKNTAATRANLNLNARYRLVRKADQALVRKGTLKTVTSYNLVSSDYAAHVAQSDARERAVKGLAEMIQTQVAVYFLKPSAE